MNNARWVGLAVILLIILHQDIWFWGNGTLVFGVIPVGLLYHLGFSVTCAILWALSVRFCWPDALEAWADES
ncbi:MAG: hypothetical protein KC917_01575 [Candidatus Omnitrophica bacterium]|nr:hypothetical protein [Phycisphaerales bacterium]MCA9414923.1 hypothetical protein [Candidatus Omnitrophota bacterium]